MALRIGPVGPVREAGLGSGAGLGSEASVVRAGSRRPPSVPFRAVGLSAHRRSVPDLTLGGGDPFQMRPRVALLTDQPVRRCSVGIGLSEKACVACCGVVEGPQKPRRPPASLVAPGPPAPFAVKAVEAGGGVLRRPTAGFHAAPCCGAGHSGGIHRHRRASGAEHGRRRVIALSPLLPRARTGVIRPFRGTR